MYIKLSLVNILEMVFVFIEILFKIYFSKGVYSYMLSTVYIYLSTHIARPLIPDPDSSYFHLNEFAKVMNNILSSIIVWGI